MAVKDASERPQRSATRIIRSLRLASSLGLFLLDSGKKMSHTCMTTVSQHHACFHLPACREDLCA